METFFNTTPRSIFVCLDLNLGEIHFWLNEHKADHKVLKLDHQPGQQWIPSIKIARERNRAILNPFPYIPEDFSTTSRNIRSFNFSKLLIPHLFNTICVTGLPKISTESKQAVDQLKNLLHLSNNQLSKITMFKTQADKMPLPNNEMLCFLKFHNYEMMYDFIHYHRNNQKTFNGYKSSGYKSATKCDAKTDDEKKAKTKEKSPKEESKDKNKDEKTKAKSNEKDASTVLLGLK